MSYIGGANIKFLIFNLKIIIIYFILFKDHVMKANRVLVVPGAVVGI